jgi:hypothetical protein
MLRLALATRAWTEDGISIRAVRGVSGHNGEQWSAIAGMRAASSGAFDRAAARMPNSAQRLLRDSALRKLIDVPRISFESMMRTRTRAALHQLGTH